MLRNTQENVVALGCCGGSKNVHQSSVVRIADVGNEDSEGLLPLVAANKSPKELKRIRQELRDQVSQQENEKQKQQWRTKYGDI